MRSAFFQSLQKLAEQDSRVHFLTGDLGFKVADDFISACPKQFLNMGVAEQNMMGVAAGMALSGKVVFAYSIANFPTIRCLEQVRNDICYHQANVKIVAVGCGFAYGSLGMTHHGIEDLAILRPLAGLTIVAPGDPIEAVQLTKAIGQIEGPCYLRLGRDGEPTVHEPNQLIELGKATKIREGSDITLISTGSILPTVARVADLLINEGIQTRVLSMHTLKPLDKEAIASAAQETEGIVTIEEHRLVGGLGGAVAECVAEMDEKVAFKRIGIPSVYSPYVGDQDFQRMKFGLSEEGIFKSVKEFLQKIKQNKGTETI